MRSEAVAATGAVTLVPRSGARASTGSCRASRATPPPPRVVPQPVPGAFEQAQLGAAVGVHQLARIGHGHAVVLLAVHHQQRARSESPRRRHRPEPAELASPLLHRRREVAMVDRPDVAGVLEEPSRMLGPVIEIGARTQQPGRRHTRIIGSDTDRDRSARVRAHQDDAGRFVHGEHMRDRVAQIVDPSLQREVTLAVAAPSEVERHRNASEFVGGAIHQLGKRAAGALCVERRDREPVAQDDRRTALDRSRRDGDVTRELQAVRDEPLVHPRHVTRPPDPARSGPRLAVAATHARLGERVPAVASFGEGVRAEAETHAFGDDLVDDRGVVPRIEVVDQLRALVADEAAVFELRVVLHRGSTVVRSTLRAPTNH